MSGVIADTLAAHHYVSGGNCLCGWVNPAPNDLPHLQHAAHQAELLTAAGIGDLRGLLDDLRGLNGDYRNAQEYEDAIVALLARYAPSDPTPKEPA